MHLKGFRLRLEPFLRIYVFAYLRIYVFTYLHIYILIFWYFKNSLYICSVFHFIQASQFANYAVGIFYAHGVTYSSDPRVER